MNPGAKIANANGPGATLPYAFDLWYPIARRPMRCVAAVSANAQDARTRARRVWQSLGPGESLLLVDRDGRGFLRGVLARLFSRSRVKAVYSQLASRFAAVDQPARIERFHVLPNTGDSWALLPSEPARATRAGLRILPSGRARWRIARGLLARLPRLAARLLDKVDQVVLVTKSGELVDPGPEVTPACARSGESSVAVTCGVPGRFQKIVVQIADARGSTVAFLKLSKTDDANARIKREAEALVHVAEQGLGATGPRVIDRGEHRDVRFLVLEPLFGTRAPDVLGQAQIDFLETVRAATQDERGLAECEPFTRAQRAIPTLLLRATEDERQRVQVFAALARAIVECQGDAPIRCNLAHGDFTPWNSLVAQGEVRAYDWEQAQRIAPALYDLVHFHVQTGVLVRRHGGARILRDIEQALAGPARRYAIATGTQDDWQLYAALYLVVHAIDEEVDHRVETPPFAQVQWLRDAREELAVALTARLRSIPRQPRAQAA